MSQLELAGAPVHKVVQVTTSDPVAPFFSRRRRPARRSSAPTNTTPLPGIWKAAVALAGGDVRRLVVESETSVVVLNTSR